MAKWQHRCEVYKLALGFLYFIFLVFALAFCIPTWIGGKRGEGALFFGLWTICAGSSEGGDFQICGRRAFGDDYDWMDGVRGVWVAGMFLYVLTVLYSLLENCCVNEHSRDHGLTGILAMLSGLCGAVGVIVVAIKVEQDYPLFSYFWGYMLACISSGLTLILAIILLITRNVTSSEKPRDNRTADYVFAHKQGHPYVSEYTNQGYNHNDIPLTNGVTYQHTPTAHPYTMYQDGFHNNNVPQARSQPDMYPQPAKSPYGYYSGRPQQPHAPAETNGVYTDLSNGYTNELIHAEHTLSRSNIGQPGDFARGGGEFPKHDFAGRSDYYLNGSRPY